LYLQPISAAYSSDYGTFILYSHVKGSRSILIVQRLSGDGSLPWGESGIILCDTNEILGVYYSIIKIHKNTDRALIFIEFHEGIYMGVLDLQTGKDITKIPDDNNISVPKELTIKSFPNPLHNTIQFRIELQNPFIKVQSVKVYNILGKEVKDITNTYSSNSSFTWDGTNAVQQQVAAGIYFVQLRANQLYTQKILKTW